MSNEEVEFKNVDVVHLKSGGPAMKIIDITNNLLSVVYLVDNKIESNFFFAHSVNPALEESEVSDLLKTELEKRFLDNRSKN